MDMEAIKARLRARPEKWVPAGGAEFLLRLPAREALQDIYAERGVNSVFDKKQFRKVAGPVARQAVVNWRGVRLGDIGIPETPLTEEQRAAVAPFDAELLDLYLADRPDVSAELSGALFLWLVERNKKQEEERKNS